MSVIMGKKGDVYIIDDSGAFSATFTNEATTESGVTRQYTVDDTAVIPWDINTAVTVAGYWAFQEFGLSVSSGDNSGLASTTQYYFKLAIDGGAVTEYSITTGSGTVTYANVVTLIEAAIPAGATCEFINSDIRIHSVTVTGTSAIALTAGTSGTSLFGQGNIPAVGSLETVTWASIGIDTVQFGNHGIKYATGVVQMTHTGFTSLTVSGKYHTMKQAGQFSGYNIGFNGNVVETTAFLSAWKDNVGTLKSFTFSLDGFYNNEQYFNLNANGLVLVRIYFDVGYPAYQEFALSTTSGATSGLSTSTQYYFKIAKDGGGVVEYNITTASDVTWAAIVALIHTAITGAGMTCDFVLGDVRISSNTESSSSAIACSNGTSGTNLFGSGNVPATASLQTSNPAGFWLYGNSNQSLSCTPAEVLKENLSFEGVGYPEYFTS